MSDYSVDPQTIVDFWREAGPEKWFTKDEAFDETVRARFQDIYERAALGEFVAWEDDPTGALALVLLFDQFPRNMFRDSPRMYATDAEALRIGRMALERGDHETVGEDLNQFLAMPLMHSEELADQEACCLWMTRIGPDNVPFAEEHREIVARFGRFPHRNAILDRPTTPEEAAFLESGGFAG